MSARTIHPFPARMAPEIALSAIPARVRDEPQLLVIDPMCGSGTVLAAATQRGQRALGIDIDPLAVMMSTVATSRADFSNLASLAEEVSNWARKGKHHAPWLDDETDSFVDYWFGKKQKGELIALASAIRQVDDETHRLALQLALSRTIITKSPQASLAADTSHSRPHRVQTESNYDVYQGFRVSSRNLAKLLGARNQPGSAKVLLGDSRSLGGIGDGIAQLAVTSPPYLNALDYMRGHKMALIWFGYSIPTLREIRRDSIGAERALDGPAHLVARRLAENIKGTVQDPTTLPEATILRFADDMVRFARQLRRVLSVGGTAVLVVGNSTLRGNYIRNDLVAQNALEEFGFELIDRHEREIPPQRRYMPIRSAVVDSSVSKRMRFEVVLKMEALPYV